MKKLYPIVIIIATLSFSCSMVKNPSASNNFKRVKYNAHLKLANKVTQKSKKVVQHDKEELAIHNIESTIEEMKSQKLTLQLNKESEAQISSKPLVSASIDHNTNSTEQLIMVENQVKNIHNQLIRQETEVSTSSSWWDSDPEDWPLEQIILAAIALLLVLLAIYLLVALLGGVIGGILGLIILLVLAYFVVQHLS